MARGTQLTRAAQMSFPQREPPKEQSPYEKAKETLRGALCLAPQKPEPENPRDYMQSAYTSLKFGSLSLKVLEALTRGAKRVADVPLDMIPGAREHLHNKLREHLPALIAGVKAGLGHAGRDPAGIMEKGLLLQSIPTKLRQSLEESGHGREFLSRHPGRTFGEHL